MINILPILGRPRAFLGISFEDEDVHVKEWFQGLLRACGFEVVTAERSEHIPLGEKIRRKIRSCHLVCFVLTPRDKIEGSDEWLPPSWIQGEIGIAYDSGKRIAVFVEEYVATKGMIPSIDDYTSFSRHSLHKDVIPILESILSLRLPEIQDAVEALLHQQEFSPIIILTALRNVLLKVASLRRMKAALQDCPVVSLIQDRTPVLILGRGSDHGVVASSTWLISRLREPEDLGIEEQIGRVRIIHVQPFMSQARFDDLVGEAKLRESLGHFAIDGSVRQLKGWRANAEDPDLLRNISVTDIDKLIRLIDELLLVGR